MFVITKSQAGVPVLTSSSLDKDLIQVSGFACTLWDARAIEYFRGGDLDIEPNTPVILVSRAAASSLSESHLAAVLSHEEAHCVLGHVTRAAERGAEGLVNNADDELEADRYAANIHGKTVVKSAIVKIVKWGLDHEVVMAPLHISSTEERKLLRKVMLDTIKFRTDALS